MHVNCTIIAMLYTHSIGNQLSNKMVVFKMCDSVPRARYSPVCNVLRLWRIPTYRVYRLYDKLSERKRAKIVSLSWCVRIWMVVTAPLVIIG